MSTTIKLRRSSTPGSLPSTSSLANGEVVLNTADGKLFFKKTVGGIDSLVSIRQLNSGTGVTVDANGNINATGLTVRRTDGNTGAVSTTISNVTGINFDALTGFNLEDLGSGNVFVSLGSTFKTLQVAGQTSLVAMGEDTLVINAGAGISITTSTTPAKTLTISSIISAGYSGSVGYSGSIGGTGYTGSWGYFGSTGYTGSRGTDGVVGYWGSVGYSGSFGSVGYSGSLGNTGYTGSWGYFGSTGYTGSQGAGYTGSAAIVTQRDAITQTFVANGSQTIFTLTISILNQTNAIVTLDGLMQVPTTHYSISNSTLTFTSAPIIDTIIEVRNIEGTVIGTSGYTGSIGVGYAGSIGAVGYIGSTGSVGYTGSQGYWGSVGYTGSWGYFGSTGYTGSVGYTGSWGYFGSTGYTGSVGYTGSASTVIGYWGSVGYTGSWGYFGSVGYTGSIGVGYAGSIGIVGYTGSWGYFGSVGYTGSIGVGYTGSSVPSTIPVNSQSSSYTLQASDNGVLVLITTGGVTVPSGVFSIGMTATILNNSASNQTITQGSSVTMYLSGMLSATTGNRTLSPYGLATVICFGTNTFAISGPGLS